MKNVNLRLFISEKFSILIVITLYSVRFAFDCFQYVLSSIMNYTDTSQELGKKLCDSGIIKILVQVLKLFQNNLDSDKVG